jgi:polyisoprenyl-phosphate glycosyltransferase
VYNESQKPLLTVIVPCFNEAKSIKKNLSKANNISLKYPIEFIFINNGSIDDTDRFLNDEKLAKYTSRIKFIRIEKNGGYGHALKLAIARVSCDYIGWTHGDGQTDLYDLVKAFKLIRANPDIDLIKGFRIGRSFSEVTLSRSLSLICSIIFLRNFAELNAQPTILKHKFLSNLDSASNTLHFDIDVYIYAKLNGAVEKRVPVVFPPRLHGVSSWNRGYLSKIIFSISVFTHLLKLRLKL